MSVDAVDRFAKLDACAVSDAADALGLAPAATGFSRMSGDGLLVGIVSTMTLVEGTPPPDAPKVHLGATAIDQGGPDTVIVVSHPGIEAGGWGGVLSNGAQAKGIRGVIVDGPCRDVDEAASLGFRIFARRATARTARGRVYEAATDAPITVEGQTVQAGDYVIADGSGVVFVPADHIDALLAKAEQIAAKEALMTKAVRAGTPVTQVMGADYEDMLR